MTAMEASMVPLVRSLKRLAPGLLLALLAPIPGHALSTLATASPNAVAGGIHYQGRLEEAGVPVHGTRSMTFRLYDSATGGTLLWGSEALTVSASNGVFGADLSIPLPALTGAGLKYLEIDIEGTVLAPREALGTVPYAMVAKTLEGTVDISSGGLSVTTATSASNPALFVSSDTGNIGIGTQTPSTTLDVAGSIRASGQALPTAGAGIALTWDGTASNVRSHDWSAGARKPLALVGSDLYVNVNGAVGAFVEGTGRVGVGTTAPGARLHVSSANAGNSDTVLLVSSGTGAGQELLSVKGDGGVGIGTTSVPDGGRLQVVGGDVYIGAHPSTHLSDLTSAEDLLVRGNVVIDGQFIAHNDAAGSSVTFSSAGDFAIGVSTFVVTQGRVGIGTSSPSSILQVQGASVGAPIRATIYNSDGTDTNSHADLIVQSNTDDGGDPRLGLFINGLLGWTLGVDNADGGKFKINPGSTLGVLRTGTAFSLDTAGKLGVGISSPTARFHAYADTGADRTAVIENRAASGDPGGLLVVTNRSVGPGAKFAVGTGVLGTHTTDFIILNSGYAGFGKSLPEHTLDVAGGVKLATSATAAEPALFVSTGTGYIGIGTGNPQAELHLRSAGDTNLRIDAEGAGNQQLAFADSGTDRWELIRIDADDSLRVGELYAGYRMTFQPGGNVGVGTTAAAARLHVSSASAAASDTVLLVSSGTGAGQELLAVKGDGKVGIGTSAPKSSLQVASGHIQFPFVGSAPAAAECDSADEAGRVVVYANTAAAGDAQLYICDWTGAAGAWTVK
ncbi:MAG: hypothetical protein HY554_14855 [Elusimicrobia bacterium]|nr:hypothetical protein [Elusimicrobiota bacterium]